MKWLMIVKLLSDGAAAGDVKGPGRKKGCQLIVKKEIGSAVLEPVMGFRALFPARVRST
jgi:hypothetical protein